MKVISHRGNLNGPNKQTENTIESIKAAINLGFDVEIDVWYIDNILYLGHDSDSLITDYNLKNFLLENSSKLWIHCKNIESLVHLLNFSELNLFGHSNDEYVLTSKHNIFCKPGVPTNEKSIIVMPEMSPIYSEDSFNNCYGVLTDYPMNIKEKNFKLFVL
jgi:glycerophosphoryl diester phosphodiesterase